MVGPPRDRGMSHILLRILLEEHFINLKLVYLEGTYFPFCQAPLLPFFFLALPSFLVGLIVGI